MANNKIYIAAAGSGKTTFIVHQAMEQLQNEDIGRKKILIISYTSNNQNNVAEKIIRQKGYIPKGIQVAGWYEFLLDYWIRPFKGTVVQELYDRHVGMVLVEGISGTMKLANGQTIMTYHDSKGKYVDAKLQNCFSDKMAEFACDCWEKNKESLLERLGSIVDTIYIDEAQDLAAWDYDVIKVIMKNSNINCVLCGDPRQHTYSSSASSKHGKYNGNIAQFANAEINKGRTTYVEIDYTTLNQSHRCISEICDFASRITSTFSATQPCRCEECVKEREKYALRKGMFLLRKSDIARYVSTYSPLTLVWNKNVDAIVTTPAVQTYGASKGLQSDATIIYPTKSILKAFKRPGIELKDVTRCKFYVAVTRAKFCAAIVVEDDYDNTNANLPFWE